MRDVAVTGNSSKKTASVDEIATLITGVDMICLAFDILEVAGGIAMTNPFEDENGEYLVLVNR